MCVRGVCSNKKNVGLFATVLTLKESSIIVSTNLVMFVCRLTYCISAFAFYLFPTFVGLEITETYPCT